MKLIRENKEKQRRTYFCEDRYKKVWDSTSPDWISEHVELLKKHVPGYVLDFGTNWIDYTIIPGVPASTLSHSPEFINRVYQFCLDSIVETSPYVHGDWTLSNILVDGDTLRLCDWDNLGIYPMDEVKSKLISDLTSAFGTAFQKCTQQS
jgi:RIO-like serine/threonine protein kinase